MRSLCWTWTTVRPIIALGFFFLLGLLERFVQSPLRPWGSRAKQQMHHGAHWDQASPDKPWLCLDFPLVSCISLGRFSNPVMENYFKELLRNIYYYFKGSILLLFSLEQGRLQHSVIDVVPGSLLRRSGLLREAVPWGLTQCGQPCCTLPNPILSVLTHLGLALLGDLAALRKRRVFLFFLEVF